MQRGRGAERVVRHTDEDDGSERDGNLHDQADDEQRATGAPQEAEAAQQQGDRQTEREGDAESDADTGPSGPGSGVPASTNTTRLSTDAASPNPVTAAATATP